MTDEERTIVHNLIERYKKFGKSINVSKQEAELLVKQLAEATSNLATKVLKDEQGKKD